MSRSRLARLAPLGILLAGACALAAASSRSPTELVPERAWAKPSFAFPFGCGEAGVDLFVFSAHALVRGAALALTVALFSLFVGLPLGAAAALARGRFERAVLRVCDLLQAFPTFLLALSVLAAVRAPTRVHLGLVFALTAWAPFARLALVRTQAVRDSTFVEAARALGATQVRVLIVHVVPNVLGVLAVQLGSSASALVVSEAALSFVGLGVKDGLSLGVLLDQGVASMLRAPHVLVVASSLVLVTSLAFLVGGRAAAPR